MQNIRDSWGLGMAVLAKAGKALVTALKFAFLPGIVPAARKLRRDIAKDAGKVATVAPKARDGRIGLVTRAVLALTVMGTLVLGAGYVLVPAMAQSDTSLFTAPNEATDMGMITVKKLFDEDFTSDYTSGMRTAFIQTLGLFNTAVLAIAGLILLYHILAIVAETAKTGKPFGNRFNEVWAPIRLIVAIGLLVPLPMSGNNGGNTAGFSAGQHIVLQIAYLSNGLASNMWTAFGTVLTGQTDKSVKNASISDTYPVAYGLMRSLACMDGINKQVAMTNGGSSGFWYPTVDARITVSGDGLHRLLFGTSDKPDLCGGLEVATMKGIESEQAARMAVASAYTDALFADHNASGQMGFFDWMFNASGNGGVLNAAGFGAKFANSGKSMWDMSDKIANFVVIENQADLAKAPTQAELAQIITAFDDAVVSKINSGLSEYRSVAVNQMKEDIATNGWMGAPFWFPAMGRINATIGTLASTRPFPIPVGSLTPCPPNASTSTTCDPGINGEMYKAAQNSVAYFDSLWNNTVTSLGAAAPDGSTTNTTNSTASKKQTPDEVCAQLQADARSSAAAAGAAVEDTSLVEDAAGWVGSKVTKFLAKITVGPNDVCQLMYASANPLSNMQAFGNQMIRKAFWAVFYDAMIAFFISKGVSGILTAIAALTITAGIVLAYVLPIMPFVRFTFGVVGWLVSLFAAMVAVPLWALAHLRIDGDGLPGPGAMNGYMMLLSILLRPTLMVFGLISSLMVLIVIIDFLNNGFFLLMFGLNGSGDIGPLQNIMYMITYAAVAFALANITFKMIDIIPSEVMKWINAPVGPDFDENMTGAIVAAGTASFRATDAVRNAVPGGGAWKAVGMGMAAKRLMANKALAKPQGGISKAE